MECTALLFQGSSPDATWADCAPVFAASGVVIAAVVAFASALLGVVVGKYFDRMAVKHGRRMRMEDLIIALHAEIEAGKQASEQPTRPVRASAQPILEPFGFADRTDFVFDNLKGDISLLPQEIIRPIVLYYKETERTNLAIDHILHARYIALSDDRKTRYLQELAAKKADQTVAAAEAIRALDRYLRTNMPAAWRRLRHSRWKAAWRARWGRARAQG